MIKSAMIGVGDIIVTTQENLDFIRGLVVGVGL